LSKKQFSVLFRVSSSVALFSAVPIQNLTISSHFPYQTRNSETGTNKDVAILWFKSSENTKKNEKSGVNDKKVGFFFAGKFLLLHLRHEKVAFCDEDSPSLPNNI